MTVLSANAIRDRKDGDVIAFAVDGAVDEFYKGGLMCADDTGYLRVGADTAGWVFLGVAYESLSQTAVVSDGTNNLRVWRRGLHKFAGSGLAITDVGKKLFLSDDNTVTLVPGHVYVGNLAVYVSSTECWVDIEPAVRAASGDKIIVSGSIERTQGAVLTEYVHLFTCPAGRKATILAGKVSAIVVPAHASATCLLNIYKYDLSATADEAVLETADYSLKGLTAKQAANLTLQSTDATYLDLDPGDVVYARVVASADLTTEGEGIGITLEIALD